MRHALDVGYRHLDTATAYGNEDRVGAAIRDSGLARGDVFVTTKLPPDDAKRARSVIDASLRALGTDYVDLWLIHWPVDGEASPSTWRELLAVRDEGKARAVGVSNYSPAQIDELVAATGTAPAVNQIPWSPFEHDEKRLAHSRERGVVLEGYSPFRRSDLDNPVLRDIAETHGVTAAQVVLRWHVQHEVVVIPKSATPERIETNFAIWDLTLSDDEMRRLDDLGRG